MPFCSKENSFSVSHPAISKDGNTMIFTSDKQGGKGGMDLYIVKKKGGKWGVPKNLGSNVNSKGNEIFPTLHDDGTIYFSSNGWGGFGGLDIFSTNYEKGKWQQATNIGYPINGPYDDSGLVLFPNKQIGYFASNRKGGKGFDDIYEIFIKQEKATQMLADKSLINAPSPIKSSASAETVVKKVEAVKVEPTEKEIKEEIAETKTKSIIPKIGGVKKEEVAEEKENSNKKDSKFSPKEEVNVFVPKDEDVAIGKVFYLIGSVIEYGKDINPIKNAVIEVLDHTNNSKQIHYADKEGNFYMPLELAHEYTVVHSSMGKIQDFKKIDTKFTKSSEVTHIVLRGKKPYQLQEYVEKIFDRDVEEIVVENTQTVKRTTPQTIENVVSNTSDNYTFFDNNYKGATTTKNIVYKIQLGAFNRDLSTQSSYFKKVDDYVEKEIGPNDVKRYLTGYYTDYYTAKSQSEQFQQQGFKKAFVAVYINGERQEKDTKEILKELGINP